MTAEGPAAAAIIRSVVRNALFVAVAALLAGCSRNEPVAEARLAQALEAIQRGRFEEASRALAAIKPGGGWLRAATWSAPLALRLRAQLSLKAGALEETERLLKEYDHRYGGLAPGAYARHHLEFMKTYKDWQGVPALLYLRGVEAETEAPALALREWRTLLRDYPHSTVAPTAQLKLGLLQQRLENPTWALSDLGAVARLEADALDPDGNPVAPQALIAIGQIHRDQRQDLPAAKAAFEEVLARFGKAELAWNDREVVGTPASLARLELAAMAPDGGAATLEGLLTASPPGLVTAARVGDVRMEARLLLAEQAARRRDWEAAKGRLLEVAKLAPDVPAGSPEGPRRWYGYEAIDRLEALGARSPQAALDGLTDAAAQARRRELWAYAAMKRIRLLARLGRAGDARTALAELEKRAPTLDCDAQGDGLLLVPAREARRMLGGGA